MVKEFPSIFENKKFQFPLSISVLVNQKPHNQSTENQTIMPWEREKNPQKERRITRTGLLSDKLVNQDHDPKNMNGFRGNKEMVPIFDKKVENQQRSKPWRHGKEGLHFHGLSPHPSKKNIHRRIPPPSHPSPPLSGSGCVWLNSELLRLRRI